MAAADITRPASSNLIAEIEAYAQLNGMHPSRVTRLAINDAGYYAGLKSGHRKLTVVMAQRLRTFMRAAQAETPRPTLPRPPQALVAIALDPPGPPVRPPEVVAAERSSAALINRIERLYVRVAGERGCSVEAARLVLNYSPAQIQRMAA